jgi:hypothetical protein
MDGRAHGEGYAVDAPSITLRLRVSPLPVVDVPRWRLFFGRLPAVSAIRLDAFDGAAATFQIDAVSVSRLHAQLQHVSRTLCATFAPTELATLSITLPDDDMQVPPAATERPDSLSAQPADATTLRYDLERDQQRGRGVALQRPPAGGRTSWLTAALGGVRWQRPAPSGDDGLDLTSASRGWA